MHGAGSGQHSGINPQTSIEVKWSEVTQSCPTLCNPMDCSLPGSSVQARVLERFAISFSRGSSRSRDQTQVSCIVGRCFTIWATREALNFYWSRDDEAQSGPERSGSSHLAVRQQLSQSLHRALSPQLPPWEGSQQELPALGFPWQPVTKRDEMRKPQAESGTFLNLESSLQVGLLQPWEQCERDLEEREFMWRNNVHASP